MGRGVHIKDETIIEALKACKGMIYLTARRLRCDQSTIHRRANANPKIRAVIEQERQEFVDTAELALLGAVTRGEAWAVCFALKTQGRQRGYSERWDMEELRRELEAFKNELSRGIAETKAASGKDKPKPK